MAEELNSYELSRDFFNWCFENPDEVTPTHVALYFFIVEHCNRLGWKVKFGLPTQMSMDAIGVKNWRTYSKAFNDLSNWGFFKIVERSKNQYSATVIALVKNTKANTKALTKATQKHLQKQSSSIAVINKPINLEPINLLTQLKKNLDEILESKEWIDVVCKNNKLDKMQFDKIFFEFSKQVLTAEEDKTVGALKSWFGYWLPKNKNRVLSESEISIPLTPGGFVDYSKLDYYKK